MRDLIEELRAMADRPASADRATLARAADRITALEAENARLREAVERANMHIRALVEPKP